MKARSLEEQAAEAQAMLRKQRAAKKKMKANSNQGLRADPRASTGSEAADKARGYRSRLKKLFGGS